VNGRAPDDSAMDEEDLDPREAERVRRRNREAQAQHHELMRSGMSKVFKQIQDAQKKDADEALIPRRRPSRGGR
jgi:hypothetical protein